MPILTHKFQAFTTKTSALSRGFLVLGKIKTMRTSLKLFLGLIFAGGTITAQSNINDLLAAGLNDANRFTEAYLSPVAEGVLFNLGGSWLNTAKAKPLGGFEISVVGAISPLASKADKTAFELNIAEYENLRFADGSTSKQVSTALGDISGIGVVIEDELGLISESFELPTGIGSALNFIPSGYLQASVGLIKGTEIKGRFLPQVNTDEIQVSLYGVGLMHDFTSHVPANKLLPIAVSGFVGYTKLSGDYKFSSTGFISGQNQRIALDMGTWSFLAAISTTLPIINFYGTLGYVSGESQLDLLGSYQVTTGPFQTTYNDPISVANKASGVTASVGTKLKLGFFRLHAEYTKADFDLITAGVHLGFR